MEKKIGKKKKKTKRNYNKMITKYKLFENKKEIFEIGTKVICSKGNQSGYEMLGAIGHITGIFHKGYSVLNNEAKGGLMYNKHLHFIKPNNEI